MAKEFNNCVRPDLFSVTPPTEGLKLLWSRLATGPQKRKFLYADVSRAYVYARVVRPLFVVLPPEDILPGEEGMVGELYMSMYGTRDAAQNRAKEILLNLGRRRIPERNREPLLVLASKQRCCPSCSRG